MNCGHIDGQTNGQMLKNLMSVYRTLPLIAKIKLFIIYDSQQFANQHFRLSEVVCSTRLYGSG